MLLRHVCMFLALSMVAFAMMFGCGTMRFCSVFVVFGCFIMFIFSHGDLDGCQLPVAIKLCWPLKVPATSQPDREHQSSGASLQQKWPAMGHPFYLVQTQGSLGHFTPGHQIVAGGAIRSNRKAFLFPAHQHLHYLRPGTSPTE